MSEQLYIYTWGNNSKRATFKGRICRLLRCGSKNTVAIQFVDNGEIAFTSRMALRKKVDNVQGNC